MFGMKEIKYFMARHKSFLENLLLKYLNIVLFVIERNFKKTIVLKDFFYKELAQSWSMQGSR